MYPVIVPISGKVHCRVGVLQNGSRVVSFDFDTMQFKFEQISACVEA